MILDMHTHILPGIDDGAKDVEMSLEMLTLLEQDGVSDVFLTPHFYFSGQDVSDFLRKRREAFILLRSSYKGKIRLHLGAEVEFSNIKIDYGIFKELSIDSGKYILLELPYQGGLEKDIIPKLSQFTYQTGLYPIIAHVERYEGVQKHPWLASELIDMGCLLQVNTKSVMESNKGSLVDALLRHGQVHLLGTDCHNITFRKPSIRPAMVRIGQQYGMEYRNYLEAISRNVMNGVPVQIHAEDRIRKFLGKYR